MVEGAEVPVPGHARSAYVLRLSFTLTRDWAASIETRTFRQSPSSLQSTLAHCYHNDITTPKDGKEMHIAMCTLPCVRPQNLRRNFSHAGTPDEVNIFGAF